MYAQTSDARPLYQAIWRWHFFAALFVAPFLVLLPASGMVMLVSTLVEARLHQDLLTVSPGAAPLPASVQLAAVQAEYPDATPIQFVPGFTPDASSEVPVAPGHAHHAQGGHGSPSISVYVNPYTGQVLGARDPAATVYAWAKQFHGSLLAGVSGEYLIEAAAGLAVLMLITGAYLAWPANRTSLASLVPRRPFSRRNAWRALHGVLGLALVVPLLFFLISGLTWTSVWGGKLVQAWSALPGQSFSAPASDHTHATLEHSPHATVPWVLQPTPLPVSGSCAGAPGIAPGPIDLDAVVSFAGSQGFEHYRIHLPREADSVWTVSATTIAGDIRDPRAERTVHLDRHTGHVLADLRFADYSSMGQAMAASIPLHQGDLGVWNIVLNLAISIGLISLVAAGGILWWKRRPATATGLAPPPAGARARYTALFLMLAVSVLFPLALAAILLVLALDWLVVSRVPRLQALFQQAG